MTLYEEIKEELRNYQKLLSLTKKMEIIEKDYSLILRDSGTIAVSVSSVNDLRKARKLLRETFGEWKDSINQVWNVNKKTGAVSYKGKDIPEVEIWLDLDKPELEKYLHKSKKFKNCRFREINESHTSFVCEVNHG